MTWSTQSVSNRLRTPYLGALHTTPPYVSRYPRIKIAAPIIAASPTVKLATPPLEIAPVLFASSLFGEFVEAALLVDAMVLLIEDGVL